VPFPAFLVGPLASAQEGKQHDALVFGAGAVYLPTPTQGDGWFAGARRRASESDPTFPPAVTLHDLRHTAASLAISAGANVKAVQRMLGHAEYLRVRGPLNIAFGGRWYCLSVPGRCAAGGHWRPTARVFMT
jgi:hypothetical protein